MKALQRFHLSDDKQRERKLRISEEKYRKIVENVGMGVSVISPRMQILEMNSIMQQWFPHITADGESFCYQSLMTTGSHSYRSSTSSI